MHKTPRRTAPPLALTFWMAMGMAGQAHLAHSATPPVKTAYRCTAPQGRVTYSQQPCASGTAERQLQAQDDRTEAQRQQAEEAVRRDKAMAHEQAWQARLSADHAARQKPSDLSGKVKPVSVGQREVDRRGTPAEPLRNNPKLFRTKVARKAAHTAPQKAAHSASSAA